MKAFTTIPSAVLIGFLQISLVYSSPVEAHEVTGPGDKPIHRHVYKRNTYGQGATAGHHAQPAGSHGIVIWQASPNQRYGRARAGIRIPHRQKRPPSQLQMYKQKPVFSKNQKHVPKLNSR